MAVEAIPIESRALWLALRGENVNASEVAIVCGEGAYGSMAGLYAEKKGIKPPQVDTAVLRRGRWGEAAVFEALADECHGWTIVRAKPGKYYRDRKRRMGATPDGFAEREGWPGRGVIQCKTVARSVFRRAWLDEPSAPIEFGEATVPAHYKLQVLTEMMLTDCAWGVLAAVVFSEFDLTLRLFEVERDAAAEAMIAARVETFWRDHFDPGIPPQFEPAKDEALVKALYPRADGTLIDLTGDNRAMVLADDLATLQAGSTAVEKDIKAIKTELAAKLGDHTWGLLADGRCVQWKHQPRRESVIPASNPRILKVLKSKPRHIDEDIDE